MTRTVNELCEAIDNLYPAGTAPGIIPVEPQPPRPQPTLNLPSSFIPQEADALLQQLADTDDTWSGAAALYGPGGLFDNARKSFLDVIALKIADGYAQKGEKVTQDHINRMAHADPGYIRFLDQHTRDRALFLALDQQRERLKTRLKLLTYGGRA